MRTDLDIGAEKSETITVSGFYYAIFQGEIQKISFPQYDLWGGLELNLIDIKGRYCGFFVKSAFFIFYSLFYRLL